MPRLSPFALCAIATVLAACGSSKKQGSEGGACFPNGTCNAGLVCLGDTCVQPSGDGGTDGGTFVCDSDFMFESAPFSACVSESCCTEFDRCFPDAVCRACLDTTTTECETDVLFMPLVECIDANCPSDFCDSGAGFNAGDDPFACNACVDANCCEDFDECVGGDGSPNLNDCLECLNDAEGVPCQSAPVAVRDGAEAVAACIDANCSVECSGIDL